VIGAPISGVLSPICMAVLVSQVGSGYSIIEAVPAIILAGVVFSISSIGLPKRRWLSAERNAPGSPVDGT